MGNTVKPTLQNDEISSQNAMKIFLKFNNIHRKGFYSGNNIKHSKAEMKLHVFGIPFSIRNSQSLAFQFNKLN